MGEPLTCRHGQRQGKGQDVCLRCARENQAQLGTRAALYADMEAAYNSGQVIPVNYERLNKWMLILKEL